MKNKLADTSTEEFRNKDWKSKKLQNLKNPRPKTRKVKAKKVVPVAAKPWWSYDGEE